MIEVSLTAVHFAWVKWFSYLFATGWLRNCRCGDDRQRFSWQLRWYRFDGCGSRRRRRLRIKTSTTAEVQSSSRRRYWLTRFRFSLPFQPATTNSWLLKRVVMESKQSNTRLQSGLSSSLSLSLSLSLTHSGNIVKSNSQTCVDIDNNWWGGGWRRRRSSRLNRVAAFGCLRLRRPTLEIHSHPATLRRLDFSFAVRWWKWPIFSAGASPASRDSVEMLQPTRSNSIEWQRLLGNASSAALLSIQRRMLPLRLVSLLQEHYVKVYQQCKCGIEAVQIQPIHLETSIMTAQMIKSSASLSASNPTPHSTATKKSNYFFTRASHGKFKAIKLSHWNS